MVEALEIQKLDHIGIRVADGPRAEAFYGRLGFTVVQRFEPHHVIILRNPAGVEINLIVNAEPRSTGNVLMDTEQKHPGFTHVALRVASIDAAVQRLAELAIPISDGPVQLGEARSLFVRDPDRNVIELREGAA